MKVPADADVFAIGVHPEHGVAVGQVTSWKLGRNGVEPVINEGRVSARFEVTDIVRGDAETVAKTAALRQLLDFAGRATTDAQWQAIRRIHKAVMTT